MKKFPFIILIIATFIAEVILCFVFVRRIQNEGQDTVLVNSCLHSVSENFGEEEYYLNELPYSVIDNDGNVLYSNRDGNSLSVNEAVGNNDTILDVVVNDETVGKMLIRNTTEEQIEKARRGLMVTMVLFSLLQTALILIYYFYLQSTILRPFRRMNEFAVRIAGGNLDVPLDVDKKHVFGSFTEAFDLMRSELKKAQMAEKKANDEKKETIAKLSHDIKTPVASIKSSSEIGYELAKDDKTKEYFHLINEKADQITTLTDNLFNSSIQDITEISVNPAKQPSSVVEGILRNSDYRKKAVGNPACVYAVPACEVLIDKLRLQQVFDNLFMNSYKYADTDITIRTALSEEYLTIEISDSGPGVKEEELPLLKEKYKRGGNSEGKEGAGLGLFLSDYFLTEMHGKLEIAGTGGDGFTAKVFLRRM